MKARFALIVAGIMLGTVISCGRSEPEQSIPDAPPASQPRPADSTIAGYEVIQIADSGSVAGTLTVSGTIPKLAPRQLNKDADVCGKAPREAHQLIVNRTGGLKNAIVTVLGVKRGKAIPAAAQNSQIDQNKCEYAPHVMVVPVNTELAILNSDPILHNIHFYQNDDSLFNIAQPVQGQVNKYKLEKAGFVYAECDVHGWMQGHVAVVDNPYFAVTDDNGKFSILDLPPGTYTVNIWHEYLGETTQDITVPAKGEVALNLDLRDLLVKKNPAANPVPITSVPVPAPKAAPDAAPGVKAAAPAEVIVQMQSEGGTFRFEPANLTIKAGTTVKWINMSDNRHSATDDPKFEKAAGQAVLPSGVEPWTTPFLPNGESATHTFTVPGKYQYFCRNHAQFGMVAGITVVP